MAKEKYTIELEGSLFELAAQKAAIQTLVKMNADDRNTMIAYSKLTADHRGRVGEIIRNNKALEKLKEFWTMLKSQFA